MRDVHIVLGVATVAVNVLAGLYGVGAWWQGYRSPGFWPALRFGQALVVAEAALGLVLVAMGKTLPSLHLIYGLVPLAVAFVAEQLRLVAAQTVLDRRGLEGREAIAALPETERRMLVLAIVRREIGIMGTSALVVAFLALRAGHWL
jgi:hypothetical protein